MDKWTRFRSGWVMLALLGTALACALPGQAETPTPVKKAATPTRTQPALIELIPSNTPTSPPPTDVPTATATPNQEPWRIPPMPGAVRLGTDHSTEIDKAITDVLSAAARELSIPAPYSFEVYDLINGTRFVDVTKYYDTLMTRAGLKKRQDDTGGNGNGTVIWDDPHDKSRRYGIKYYSATPSKQARMFVVYGNPKNPQ